MEGTEVATDAEDHRHLPVVDIHPLDERADELPLGRPIGRRQPILHLRREGVEVVNHEAELAVEQRRVG